MAPAPQYDVAIIGAGIAGLATAARLQAAGLSTVVLEAHRQPGGCAGFFCRRGYSFDVGATTLVDFEPGGMGGELLDAVGMTALPGEALPGYVAWLPDRRVTLHRDRRRWEVERLRALGDTPRHRQFWSLIDDLADAFWQASRRGIKLPVQNTRDLLHAIRCIGLSRLSLARYWNWTVGDALRRYGLRNDAPLVGLLSMLLEDTVHSSVDDSPLINGALGITIRGAGLTRPAGGMRGFVQRFVRHYRALGGRLQCGARVGRIAGRINEFQIATSTDAIFAKQVVSALPATLTAAIAPAPIQHALRPYLVRDAQSLGGAIVVFLGVPETEVRSQSWTHHQILHDYSKQLGRGNNMFVSVSAPGDLQSGPAGHRAVMISTHCDLAPWDNLPTPEYRRRKQEIGNRMLDLARIVYPDLGRAAVVHEVAAPPTYQRFTLRPRGAVGGIRLTLQNSNQAAIPHDVGYPGFWLVGDTTWPGLGTVACTLASRIVAGQVMGLARRKAVHAS